MMPMRDKGDTCAMCDSHTNWSSLKIPYEYTISMKNATKVEDHAPIVEVFLCKECKEISLKMIDEYDTSPFPEWDLSNCRMKDAPVKSKNEVVLNALMRAEAAEHDEVLDAKAETAKLFAYEVERQSPNL